MKLLPLVLVPALLFLLLPCLPNASVCAEDEDPAQAFAAKVRALPAPSAEAGYRFDGVLRVGGKPRGHVTFLARPAGDGATAGWEVVEQVVIKSDGQVRVEVSEVALDAHLGLQSGRVDSNEPGDGGIEWQRTEKGFRASRTTKNGEVSEEQVRNFEHAGTALTTLAATVLFARLALPEKAVYESFIFEVEDGLQGEAALKPVRLEVLGEQDFQGSKVLTVRGVKESQALELLFRPEDRQLVAARLEDGDVRLEMLSGDVWSMPAQDPLTASMRVALAFGSGNVELLDDVIHWPAFHAALMAQRQADAQTPAPSLAELRQTLLAQWSKALPKNPPEMIQQLLQQLKPQLKWKKLDDGRVMVLYPELFRGLKITLGKHYGFWHMVALPAVKPPAGSEDGKAPKKDGAPAPKAPVK